MAREYMFRRSLTNPTTARAALQVVPAAAIPLVVMRAQVTQNGSATSAQLGAQLCRMSAAATVTAAVAGDFVKLDPGDAAISAQVGTSLSGYNASTAGTQGDILHEEGWNTLNGFFWTPVPEERITIPGGGIFALFLQGTVPAGTYICELVLAESLTG